MSGKIASASIFLFIANCFKQSVIFLLLEKSRAPSINSIYWRNKRETDEIQSFPQQKIALLSLRITRPNIFIENWNNSGKLNVNLIKKT